MSKLEVVRFAAGTQLFAQGQVPEAMYFVLQGTVELANEHTDLVGQGALVGAVAFLNQIPSRFRARCVTDTDLFKLNEENIITLFRTHPQIGYKILQALASEVVGATHEAEKTEAKPEPLPDGIDQVLPPDHPHFSETAPEAFESLLLHTEAVCPLCDARFAAARVRKLAWPQPVSIPTFVSYTITWSLCGITSGFAPSAALPIHISSSTKFPGGSWKN